MGPTRRHERLPATRRAGSRAAIVLLATFIVSGHCGPSWADDLPKHARWPLWRGPTRDGKSPETGLLKEWPDGGPELLWTAKGCGMGFSSVTIDDGMIYTAGIFDTQTYVLAFGLAGKPRWKSPNGARWEARPKEARWAKGHYDGTRATPTVHDGMVYHLDALGRLGAYEARTGKDIWSVNVAKRFEAEVPLWGYSEQVLVDGDNLICYPGGVKGYMVALNTKTGKVVWANTYVGDQAANASPIVVEHRGIRQIITMTARSVIGVEASSGKLLWRHQHENRFKENCETPIYRDGSVYVSSGYTYGSEKLKLTFSERAVQVSRVWLNRKADNLHGGPIRHKGHLYGVGYDYRGWFCLDVDSGEIKYRDKQITRGCLTFADGMIYCLDNAGIMRLVQPSTEGLKVISRFQVPRDGTRLFFAHPVVCGGRLYVRHGDHLYAYKLESPLPQ